MRPPPPLTQIPKYPLTGGLALLAIAVTFAWNAGYSIAPLFPQALAPALLPLCFITTILPHTSIFHLFFNVYWLWVFGTLLEQHFGHLRFALIVLLLAFGSSAAEWAFEIGGVGLSGVGYGLFGLLVVLARYDRRFADAIDTQTIILFVGWFFFCILLTAQHIMAVANVAHGAGAVLGFALGWVCVSRGLRRYAAITVLALLMVMIGLGATILRPFINFSREAPSEYAYAAQRAFEEGRDDLALTYLQQAVRYRAATASDWYNLGVAHLHLKQYSEAIPPMEEALRREPENQQYKDAYRELTNFLSSLSTTTSRP